MAPDTTRKAENENLPAPGKYVESLQRELAEARAEIESLKSRASLTPLTDESVRGVLVDYGEPRRVLAEGEFYFDPGDSSINTCYESDRYLREMQPVKLRPASEFGVPAEPAQKLVPLPEGCVGLLVKDGKPTSAIRRGSLHLDGNTIRSFDASMHECLQGGLVIPLKAMRIDPALYGVPAERIRDQTELHKAQCEAIGLSAEVERQSERIASLTSAAETAESEVERLRKESAAWEQATAKEAASRHNAWSEAERLRKAIEKAVGELTDRGPYDRPKIINALPYLKDALTPPTAASGEAAMESAWLLETTIAGSPVWFISSKCRTFTTDACTADKFSSKEAAEEFAGGRKLTGWKATEHGFYASAPAAESEWDGDNLPTLLDLKGSCPNSTDGLDSVDFVRSLRDAPQVECPNCGHSIREEGDRDWIDVYRQKFRAAESERDALSARLAACEERCKELEAGIERHRDVRRRYSVVTPNDATLWSLLAPKAEGGKVQ